MARPEDIPEWAWEKAVEITMGTMAFGSPVFTGRLARAILSAVEEEREACAALSQERGKHLSEAAVGNFIATAIRNRKGA